MSIIENENIFLFEDRSAACERLNRKEFDKGFDCLSADRRTFRLTSEYIFIFVILIFIVLFMALITAFPKFPFELRKMVLILDSIYEIPAFMRSPPSRGFNYRTHHFEAINWDSTKFQIQELETECLYAAIQILWVPGFRRPFQFFLNRTSAVLFL
ncbi:hypothetical protein CJ739_1771 [Mariniflexile rhizosphaerae]|nr:hypothetical protein CJ739_1771 [Mariniflexile sp. TRM1-10]